MLDRENWQKEWKENLARHRHITACYGIYIELHTNTHKADQNQYHFEQQEELKEQTKKCQQFR